MACRKSIQSPLTALALLAAALLPSTASGRERPFRHAYYEAPSVPAPRVLRGADGVFVASRDRHRGVPTFVWAERRSSSHLAGTPPERAALAHLSAHAELYGLTAPALANARVVRVHDIGRGGIIAVIRQAVDGVPLFREELKVLMRRDDLSLVAMSGTLHADAVPTGKRGSFTWKIEGAIAKALSDLYQIPFRPDALVEIGPTASGWRSFDLQAPARGATSGLRFTQQASAREVLFPLPDRLVPAYHLEVSAQTTGGPEAEAYAYVISAVDGAVLYRRNLRSHAKLTFRVWADTDGDMRPLDGPTTDFTPHPTGTPDGSEPDFIPPSLVSIEPFNKHGDPWLPSDATETRGNNVEAYTDHHALNAPGPDDVWAAMTSPGTFDHVYDTSIDPLASPEQSMAAITQAFYVTNWLHDYWYDSGFDEAAGNAQLDNYDRGGVPGDPLLVEVQDAAQLGLTNNAFIDVREDGISPRMNLLLFAGKSGGQVVTSLGGESLVANNAAFGPKSFEVTGAVVRAVDGVGNSHDACQPIQNDISGKVALVDRGECEFQSKALHVQAAGGIGMLLANNVPGPPPFMPSSSQEEVTIPALSIGQQASDAIVDALDDGPVTATLRRVAELRRDTGLDSLIVAHEWGHYLHHRLVDCGFVQCRGQSEGWGDVTALMMALRPGDDLDGTFSGSTYATAATDDYAYFGIRRQPYSVDPEKNDLRFRHIQESHPLDVSAPTASTSPDNTEVHNVGEVWGSMVFEGLVRMLKRSRGANAPYDFAAGLRRMADYTVAGMQLAPARPTFTEQRDALLAAALAADPSDAVLLAEGFAARGAGSCAESPPRDLQTNEGVVESYEVAPELAVTDVVVDDGVVSCDDDGVLDAGEAGVVRVTVANGGIVPARDTKVTLSTEVDAISFPDGASVEIDEIPPLGKATVEVPITVAASYESFDRVELTVTVENDDACATTVTEAAWPRLNYDDFETGANNDQFESATDVWTAAGTMPEEVWAPIIDREGRRWHGKNYGALSDTYLVSPDLVVSESDPLVIGFSHRHRFESNDGTDWDGGVVEIRTEGEWRDIAKYVDPGYGGTLSDEADNPLSHRKAFVGENPSWPKMDQVVLNLGSQLAGKTIRLRFRIGTDQAVSDHGWEIDDVIINGIDNAPFPYIDSNAAPCDSSDGEGGAAPTEDPPADEPHDEGCGCHVPGARPNSGGWLALAAAAAALARLRRRAGG